MELKYFLFPTVLRFVTALFRQALKQIFYAQFLRQVHQLATFPDFQDLSHIQKEQMMKHAFRYLLWTAIQHEFSCLSELHTIR